MAQPPSPETSCLSSLKRFHFNLSRNPLTFNLNGKKYGWDGEKIYYAPNAASFGYQLDNKVFTPDMLAKTEIWPNKVRKEGSPDPLKKVVETAVLTFFSRFYESKAHKPLRALDTEIAHACSESKLPIELRGRNKTIGSASQELLNGVPYQNAVAPEASDVEAISEPGP